jgi:hypothetical protein
VHDDGHGCEYTTGGRHERPPGYRRQLAKHNPVWTEPPKESRDCDCWC